MDCRAQLQIAATPNITADKTEEPRLSPGLLKLRRKTPSLTLNRALPEVIFIVWRTGTFASPRAAHISYVPSCANPGSKTPHSAALLRCSDQTSSALFPIP